MRDDYNPINRSDAAKVNIANVYDPVKYMLDNLRIRTTRSTGDAIKKAEQQREESATLHREGVYLKLVEGDKYRNHFLYYTDEGILDYYVVLHKMTGRVEAWQLFFKNNMLQRYEYEVISEGNQGALDDEGGLWDGWGDSIDFWL